MKTHRLALVLLVLALFALAGVAAVRAQVIAPVPVVPEQCRQLPYDLTGDGRLDVNDFNLWRRTMGSGGACREGAPDTACPRGFDANGDHVVTVDDLRLMIRHYRGCLALPGIRRPGA